jgi:UDP-GlcNAc:undecaprenyl-phosphate GlcNAc-1-phosphate transferase
VFDVAAWKLFAVGAGALFAWASGPLVFAALCRARLVRANYLGAAIPTSAGVLFGLCLMALLLASVVRPFLLSAERVQIATALGFGCLGLLDDRWGTAEFKGLRGHLRALARGRITTGLIKAAGGVAIAVGATFQLRTGSSVVAAALAIALSANAFNLLDLRPLRTLKAFWFVSLLLSPVLPAPHALVLGASLPYSREEGRRRVMLGDAGSNLLGALIGTSLAMILPAPGLWIVAGVLAAFHLWAEKHSLTAWIAERPWARVVDNWGVAQPDPAETSVSARAASSTESEAEP